MFKNQILAACFAVVSLQSLADCAGSNLTAWPYGGIVSENPIFMLEGYALDQGVILRLNEEYPVFLKSGDEEIRLTVKEICVGQFELTQAILIPETKLTAGKSYEMVIENYRSMVIRWNADERRYEPVTWKVIAGEDHIAPTWNELPKETEKTLVEFGCGPAKYVNFQFGISDVSPTLVRTTVTNLSTNSSTTYYLDADEFNTFGIGHGMCSGAFAFDEFSNDYTVKFDLVDASGNFTLWGFDAIPFTKPTPENSVERE